MTLDELCSRRVVVWGLGREGLAFTRLLLGRGVVPRLVDDRPGEARAALAGPGGPGGDVAAGLTVEAPGGTALAGAEVVVRAPGVSRYRPELVAAAAAGTTVTTPMAVWLEDVADRPVLAVTGTKGKSTTASLAARILRAGGLEVALVGNIGAPVTDLYDVDGADVVVVEVSSYQAADVTVSPRVVVLTSLAPDHLDWHGGVDAYYRDKLRLVTAGPPGRLAVNAGSPLAVERTADHPDRVLYGTSGGVTYGDGWITVDGDRLVPTSGFGLPGGHNLANLCGALAGVRLLRGGLPPAAVVQAAVDGFEGLPSRCRSLGIRDGVEYVDDALASNPFAAAASVTAFAGRPLALIVGGADRGVGSGPLVDALAARGDPATVVVIPPDPGRLVGELTGPEAADRGPVADVRVADDLVGAVSVARAAVGPGGVVLFSPAAPTPDGGGGYAVRGRVFAEAAGFGPGDTGDTGDTGDR